jgi:hypothetical protein
VRDDAEVGSLLLRANSKGSYQPINLLFRCGLDRRLSISSFVL